MHQPAETPPTTIRPPRIASLFSGVAGLDRGVHAVIGGSTAWFCEVDPAASKVLATRFPDIPNLGDITAVDWTARVRRVRRPQRRRSPGRHPLLPALRCAARTRRQVPAGQSDSERGMK